MHQRPGGLLPAADAEHLQHPEPDLSRSDIGNKYAIRGIYDWATAKIKLGVGRRTTRSALQRSNSRQSRDYLRQTPLYNQNNDIQVTTWNGSLENYSINYALGAYLARTYGGAALFQAIVQNTGTGIDAIEAA